MFQNVRYSQIGVFQGALESKNIHKTRKRFSSYTWNLPRSFVSFWIGFLQILCTFSHAVWKLCYGILLDFRKILVHFSAKYFFMEIISLLKYKLPFYKTLFIFDKIHFEFVWFYPQLPQPIFTQWTISMHLIYTLYQGFIYFCIMGNCFFTK